MQLTDCLLGIGWDSAVFACFFDHVLCVDGRECGGATTITCNIYMYLFILFLLLYDMIEKISMLDLFI